MSLFEASRYFNKPGRSSLDCRNNLVLVSWLFNSKMWCSDDQRNGKTILLRKQIWIISTITAGCIAMGWDVPWPVKMSEWKQEVIQFVFMCMKWVDGKWKYCILSILLFTVLNEASFCFFTRSEFLRKKKIGPKATNLLRIDSYSILSFGVISLLYVCIILIL